MNRLSSNKNFAPGFTLMEILIVLLFSVVVAILMTILSGRSILVQEIDRTREAVRNELMSARADAIAGTEDSSWGVAFTTSSIIRFRGSSYAARNAAYDLVTAFSQEISLSGASEIVFTRPAGIPSASGTVVATDGLRSTTTTVTSAGSIEVQ